MANAAGWVALVATCIAAVMTASNLGPRVTGWGFAVFTVGAVAWVVVGAVSGQKQLLFSNIFLGLIDVIGIWRWLGRQTRISDTTRAEEARSEVRAGENLFSLTNLDGLPVTTRAGEIVGRAVDALAGCERSDRLSRHPHWRVGGVGETLRRLPWNEVELQSGKICTALSADAVARLSAASRPE